MQRLREQYSILAGSPLNRIQLQLWLQVRVPTLDMEEGGAGADDSPTVMRRRQGLTLSPRYLEQQQRSPTIPEDTEG